MLLKFEKYLSQINNFNRNGSEMFHDTQLWFHCLNQTEILKLKSHPPNIRPTQQAKTNKFISNNNIKSILHQIAYLPRWKIQAIDTKAATITRQPEQITAGV